MMDMRPQQGTSAKEKGAADLKWKKIADKPGELLSAGIVAGALLLSLGLSWLGYVDGRTRVQAREAAAQPQATPAPEPDGFQQLEDPLLVLVNEEVPLPEDWTVTPRMVHDEEVDLRMYEDLMAMFDAAAEEDIWFWVASGYRSVEEQQVILDRAVEENLGRGMGEALAEETALRTIAKPGHSEHHTGLAVDLNDVSDSFEETQAYRWLQAHAAEYGFIQRYRTDKSHITGIDNESWHYRYAGREHAQAMERLDLCLEEYVAYLREQGMP